LKYRWSRRD